MARIPVAVVGCGYIAQIEHIPNLRNNPDLKLAAIVEPRSELAAELSESLEVPAYASLQECLDGTRVEAVVIATPREYHVELVQQAAAAGKHILCEKPLAGTVDEARLAVEAARRAGVTLLVGYMRRYDRDSLEVLRLLRDGSLGTPLAVLSRFQICYQPIYFSNPLRWPDPDNFRSGYPWFPRGWSPREALLEESIHHLSLLRLLLGEPDEVLLAAGGPEAFQTVWRAGSALVTHLNVSSLAYGDTIEMYGTKGYASWRLWSPHLPYYFADLRIFDREAAEERRPVFPRVNPYLAMLRHFGACIRGEAEPTTTGEDALLDLELIDRICSLAAARVG